MKIRVSHAATKRAINATTQGKNMDTHRGQRGQPCLMVVSFDDRILRTNDPSRGGCIFDETPTSTHFTTTPLFSSLLVATKRVAGRLPTPCSLDLSLSFRMYLVQVSLSPCCDFEHSCQNGADTTRDALTRDHSPFPGRCFG